MQNRFTSDVLVYVLYFPCSVHLFTKKQEESQLDLMH